MSLNSKTIKEINDKIPGWQKIYLILNQEKIIECCNSIDKFKRNCNQCPCCYSTKFKIMKNAMCIEIYEFAGKSWVDGVFKTTPFFQKVFPKLLNLWNE